MKGFLTMTLFRDQNITQSSLQQLIDDQVTESQELEYKQDLFQNEKFDGKTKNKILKEITAFANTTGGIIIIGIEEDDHHTPNKLIGSGLSMSQYDTWHASFNQIVQTNIFPRLHGLVCTPVSLNNGQIAIVISIPKSYSRPHCCKIDNRQEYHMRVGNIMRTMEIDDLRKAFLYTNGLQDKIRYFHNERISMIMSNECIGDMGTGPKIVFHIIPEWSFELGNMIDLEYFRTSSYFKPISGNNWSFRYNIDGICIYDENLNSGILNSYTQVFHNGIIEATEIRCLSSYKENLIYDWNALQRIILRIMEIYAEMLEKNHIPKPWHILATILNGKGFSAYDDWLGSSKPLDRDIINSLDGICVDDNTMHDALKPVFNSLSHAFGYSQSLIFRD